MYRDASLSYTIVKEWAKRFHEGWESLDDEKRIVRHKSAIKSKKTWKVEEDPHIRVEELAMSVGISKGAVHDTLVDEIKVRKFVRRGSQIPFQKNRRNVG